MMLVLTPSTRMTFFQQTKISIHERTSESNLRRAFQEARNRHTVSRGDPGLLHSSHRHQLLAVNRYSRVCFGRAVSDQLSRFFCFPDRVEHNQPIFLVTLVDRKLRDLGLRRRCRSRSDKNPASLWAPRALFFRDDRASLLREPGAGHLPPTPVYFLAPPCPGLGDQPT